MRAALYGHKGIVKNLLTNGAQILWMSMRRTQCTAFGVLFKPRHTAAIGRAFTKSHSRHRQTWQGLFLTMLWPTASLMNNSESCSTFFTRDVIQIVRTMMPTTLCAMPWKAGNYEAVSLLLCAGADVDLSLLANHRLGSNPSNPCGCFECVARSPRDVTLGTDPDQTQGLRSLT